MRYYETLRYRVQPAGLAEVVLAFLAEEGFDGFLEEEQGYTLASRSIHSEKMTSIGGHHKYPARQARMDQRAHSRRKLEFSMGTIFSNG